MPTKLGDGGHGPENYNPADGKYVENSVNEEAASNRKKYEWDYKTGDVNGDDIFDVNVQSNSYVRQYLIEPEYMKDKNGKKAEITYMTPQQYYEDCAKYCFGGDINAEQLKEQRGYDSSTMEHLKNVIKDGIKFPLPYLEYDEYKKGEQEGLHRMYVAGELFGWDHKFPVLTIKWADEETKKMFEKYRERIHVESALRYFGNDNRTFYSEEDFETSLSSQINEALRRVYKHDWYMKPVDIQLKDEQTYIKIGDNQYILDSGKFDIRKEEPIFAEFEEDEEDIFSDEDLLNVEEMALLESLGLEEEDLNTFSIEDEELEEKAFQQSSDLDDFIKKVQSGTSNNKNQQSQTKEYSRHDGETYTIPQQKLENLYQGGLLDEYNVETIDVKQLVESKGLNNPNHGMFGRRAEIWGKPENYHYDEEKDKEKPIMLSKNGDIIDGNHRLYALYNDGYSKAQVLVHK